MISAAESAPGLAKNTLEVSPTVIAVESVAANVAFTSVLVVSLTDTAVVSVAVMDFVAAVTSATEIPAASVVLTVMSEL